ncbi:MAG: 2-hydroxyacyl-CoA dehydratase [Candidatus Hydrogenedentes bacterium]|nr:2-hydroxyacyl-CoA dehydratase [Candidatus Hydrogenedentota bacterium]
MNEAPARLSLAEWDVRYDTLRQRGLREAWYGGSLSRHVEHGDRRLLSLRFDNSPAALRLWNLLLTEEERLHAARAGGKKIVGAMKDLGTVPILAYAVPGLVAFYPDGAWWIPCLMEGSAGLLAKAGALGIDDTFCPVRAMLGAFETQRHFPIPDLLTCSVGATCDDFSAIAQRLEHMGHPIHWWEIPHRRPAEPGEEQTLLPTGATVAQSEIAFVARELERLRRVLQDLAGRSISLDDVSASIRAANVVRRLLCALRDAVYGSPCCPLPALEMLIAEVLPVHFCSDRSETEAVLRELLAEVVRRVHCGSGILPQSAVRLFWVNPVADLRIPRLVEDCGGRICGADYMFCHAQATIPENVPPLEALAMAALSDPMAGTAVDRGRWICREARRFGAEAMVISRIPGASHCATEGEIIRRVVTRELPHLPVIEFEVPSVADALLPTLQTRVEALIETVRLRKVKP